MTQDKNTGQFSDLGIGEKLLTILDQKGFKTPTPIQHQVISGALKGKDVVGIAQTGTGKTLAFGIPMIERILRNKKSRGQALIMTPTRELALQIESALLQIGKPLGLRTAVIIGGVSQNRQVASLRRGPHVVIATPGRLDDLMNQGLFKLHNIEIITLDEADRMLDVGFLPQIKRILQTAPQNRQTMLFSATMPKSISTLASKFMQLPLRIEIAPQGTSAENVEQEVFVIRKKEKMRLLDSVLEQYRDDKILIFSRTKHGAKRIAREIRNMGHTATEIHGNRSQPQREKALAGFTGRRFRIMVATDIAARGIDVRDISLVINFDLPDNNEDYVHRIGRTGRAGRSGKAISFIDPSQKADARKIERLIRKRLKLLALPQLPPPRPKAPKEKKPFSHGRSRRQGGGYGGPRKRPAGYSKRKPSNRYEGRSEQGERQDSGSSNTRRKNTRGRYHKQHSSSDSSYESYGNRRRGRAPSKNKRRPQRSRNSGKRSSR